MHLAATVLVALLAVEHVYILVMEMFLWSTPTGRRAFDLTPEKAETTRAMAQNQGLYNGFLAAGLAWSLIAGRSWASWAGTAAEAHHLQIFFCACVAIAGVYGGLTAMRKILFFQGVPGLLALAAVLAAGA